MMLMSLSFIAPKASAEGACILAEMGFCYCYCYYYCYCYCYRGPTHRGPKSGGELVTLFGGYYYDGLIAAIGVQHRQVPNLGVSWSRFLAVTVMMV